MSFLSNFYRGSGGRRAASDRSDGRPGAVVDGKVVEEGEGEGEGEVVEEVDGIAM